MLLETISAKHLGSNNCNKTLEKPGLKQEKEGIGIAGSGDGIG